MLKSIGWSVLTVALLLLPVGLAAQGFIYTNNDTAPNSISAYYFGVGGSLSEVTGQPFGTGGVGSGGGFYSSNRIIVVKESTNDFLYASNSGSPTGNTVSAFVIDPASGDLISVPGSPFSIGAFNDAQNSGISLAATPDGKYLFVGSTGTDSQFNLGSIAIFNIDPSTGALTPTSKSPVPSGGPMSSMKVSPDGKYLVAAIPGSSGIAVFAIRGPGMLHAVHGSPYVLSSGPVKSVEFNCAGNLLYAGGANDNIYVFNFASGNLSPVANSPFKTKATSNNVVALSTDDSTLFASNPYDNTVTAFAVDANGGFTLPGAWVYAYDTTTSTSTTPKPYPGGLAVSNLGNLLFSADVNSATSGYAGLSVFNLAGTSPIIFQFRNATVPATGFHSLAAYPPKACTGAAAPAHVNHRP